MDKFFDTTIPTNPNIFQYTDNILTNDKITDLPACANTYDDNYGVRTLGYRSCNDAYADYIVKGLDTSNKYGAHKSVADYCPVTTKSPTYMQCMATLLEKYNSNANMLQGVANDMTNLVNKRLQDRSNVINDIQLAISPYTNNKEIKDFELNFGLIGNTNQTSDEKLFKANQYFQSKYGSRAIVFADIPTKIEKNTNLIEGFTNVSITVDPYIVSNFFGQYSPVKGQYLAFDNLSVSLDFMNDNPTTTVPQTTKKTTMPQTTMMQTMQSTQTTQTMSARTIPMTTTQSSSNEGQGPSNVGKVSLIITDSNTNGQLFYNIGNIDYYENAKNIIVLNITEQTINVQNPGTNQNLQQLLVLLGLSAPTKLIMMLEQNVSDAGVKRWTYKIMNLNMDTIMVLKKNNNLD
jgi:hypothetical protein